MTSTSKNIVFCSAIILDETDIGKLTGDKYLHFHRRVHTQARAYTQKTHIPNTTPTLDYVIEHLEVALNVITVIIFYIISLIVTSDA